MKPGIYTLIDPGPGVLAQLVRRTTEVDAQVLARFAREPLLAGTALFATGGYGRCEVYPCSDIDLLLLVRDESTAHGEAIGRFIASLWDTGLKPSHAVRDASGCRDAALNLHTFTSLLDARLLSGHESARESVQVAIAAPLWPDAEFLEARRASQHERHARFQDTSNNLEPNVKDGPGGLRDLHTLCWVALRLYGGRGIDGAKSAGLLTAHECADLQAAHAHIARVRFALHRVAGRAEERLLFDHQRELARHFGFEDEHSGNLAVEQFMQAWFRAARVVDALNERVLARSAERLRARVAAPAIERLDESWQIEDGTLALAPACRVGGKRPPPIEAFAWLARRPDIEGFHSTLMSWLDSEPAPRDENAPPLESSGVAFMALLRESGDVVRALAAMARYGVLARIVPAFGRVTGRMQYDLFHVYTVDQHTLFVMRNLLHFAQRETALTALGHTLWRRQPKPELVLLAGLFHDIAKGRGGDHSELGEVEVRSAAPLLGLSTADTELVAWLVRDHLLMSVTAQKQDITDPQVVHRFANAVADTERLDALYLLTVADIQGTSPRLWNDWKAQLLEDLHAASRHALRRGLSDPLRASERAADIRVEALRAMAVTGVPQADIEPFWSALPDYAILRLGAERLAWATVEMHSQRGREVRVVSRAAGTDAVDLIVNAPDREGLFATVTAVLDRQGFDVLEARATGTRDGRVLDLFRVMPRVASSLDADPAGAKMVQALSEALCRTRLDVRPPRRRLSRQQRHFRFPLQAKFRELDAPPRTQFELVCADRPGLLARVAAILRRQSLRVHDARIATFGERAEDFFEITGEDGGPLDAPERARLLDALREDLEEKAE